MISHSKIKYFFFKIIKKIFLILDNLYFSLKFFCIKQNILNIVHWDFEEYRKIVDRYYPKPHDFEISKISDGLLSDILKFFCNDKCFLNSDQILDYQNENHSHLLLTKKDQYNVNQLKKNLIAGNVHELDYSNKILKKLHDELRKMFSGYIRSPFCFVNTRLWKTKPNSENYGPNAFHLDGFAPGHLKIMIYITPLNDDFGTFKYKKDGKIFVLDDEPKGTAIIFKNSELLHQGSAGKVHERIAIECTIMRSLFDGDQHWFGHWYGRHLKDLRALNYNN
jgi:hypothetical protein